MKNKKSIQILNPSHKSLIIFLMDKEDTDTAAQVNFPKGLYLGFNQTHHTRKCAKYVLHM